MANKIHLALIAWDQKEGGILEAVEPKMSISSKTTMNIYNMHRIRQTDPRFGSIRLKLDNGERYNVLTFFTGYGGSTSPDGFTGNYGGELGLVERVFALMLPMEAKSGEYEEILGKIVSRLVIDPENISERLKIIMKLLKSSGIINKPEDLSKFLNKYLDQKLRLSDADARIASSYEVKILHYLLIDKKETIQDLRINPAGAAACIDQEKIEDAQKKEKNIRELLEKIQRINTEKQMTDAITSAQQETIETLKADYVKIFGTLTEQIMMLENELSAIKESTQGLVQDLNVALSSKIQKIQDLEQELEEIKAKNI